MGLVDDFVNLVHRFTGGTPARAAGTAPIDLIRAKTYKPVGQCIYCGATSGPLTDEHIVPYALNGNWILPKSSCDECRKITGKVEQSILRGELLYLRAALNFQTRRPGERPVTIRLQADGREVELPITDCPIVMPFVRFPAAGLLDGRPRKNGIDVVGDVGIHWGPDIEEFARRHGLRRLSFQTTVAPAMFARMIAKIAYCHAVARFGLDALEDEIVTAVILGKSACIGDVVGCTEEEPAATPNPNDHVLRPVMYTGGLSGEDRLLAIRVKLFSGCRTPVHEIVIGRPAEWIQDIGPDYHRD